MNTTYQDITYEIRNGVAHITINRPEVRNAFRSLTLRELTEAFEAADADQNVGVVVLSGKGDKAFCAGGDIKEEKEYNNTTGRVSFRQLMHLALTMRWSASPIIAKVRGYAVGGGNELQMLCDLTIAADNAIFGQTGPRVGSVPLSYGTQLLPLLVGDKKAREIVYLTRQYTAAEAQQLGLINKMVPLVKLDEEVEQWCQELLDKSPTALRLAKVSLNYLQDIQWPSLAHGGAMMNMMHPTAEHKEGMSAFLEKRKPNWAKFR